MIDRQYSLSKKERRPTPQEDIPDNGTALDDLDAFHEGDRNVDIPAPPDMTQKVFDEAVTNRGDDHRQGEYDAFNGPNSNTAADNIIEGAGGKTPDIAGAVGQNYGDVLGGPGAEDYHSK